MRGYAAMITGVAAEISTMMLMLAFTKVSIEGIIFLAGMMFLFSTVGFLAITEKHPRRSAKRKGCMENLTM